jgi:hypothetical protein
VCAYLWSNVEFDYVESREAQMPLKKCELIRIKAKAMRRRVWFRTLTMSERAQIDLTIKFVQKVQSLLLTRVLGLIMKKLMNALESRVVCAMRDVGCGLAEKISRFAQSWGNQFASEWTEDQGFRQYLTIMWMNIS